MENKYHNIGLSDGMSDTTQNLLTNFSVTQAPHLIGHSCVYSRVKNFAKNYCTTFLSENDTFNFFHKAKNYFFNKGDIGGIHHVQKHRLYCQLYKASAEANLLALKSLTEKVDAFISITIASKSYRQSYGCLKVFSLLTIAEQYIDLKNYTVALSYLDKGVYLLNTILNNGYLKAKKLLVQLESKIELVRLRMSGKSDQC